MFVFIVGATNRPTLLWNSLCLYSLSEPVIDPTYCGIVYVYIHRRSHYSTHPTVELFSFVFIVEATNWPTLLWNCLCLYTWLEPLINPPCCGIFYVCIYCRSHKSTRPTVELFMFIFIVGSTNRPTLLWNCCVCIHCRSH